jgi:sugar phosphate isomerase/epimerase
MDERTKSYTNLSKISTGGLYIMKLGISTYSLTWAIGVPRYDSPQKPLTAMGVLEKAKENHISLVQIADNIDLTTYSEDQLIDLKNKADQLNITLEIGTRGTEPEHLLKYLEITKRLGGKLLRTLISTPDISEAEQHIKTVLPFFEKAGISMAIENHGLHTTKQLASLFDSIGHPMVGCCLDTVNSFAALETPDQVIAELAPYVLNVHIKDFDVTRIDHQMGYNVLGTAAGYGKLQVENLLNTLRNHQKDPNLILEIWVPYTHNIEDTIQLENKWFDMSLEYLKKYNFSN